MSMPLCTSSAECKDLIQLQPFHYTVFSACWETGPQEREAASNLHSQEWWSWKYRDGSYSGMKSWSLEYIYVFSFFQLCNRLTDWSYWISPFIFCCSPYCLWFWSEKNVFCLRRPSQMSVFSGNKDFFLSFYSPLCGWKKCIFSNMTLPLCNEYTGLCWPWHHHWVYNIRHGCFDLMY